MIKQSIVTLQIFKSFKTVFQSTPSSFPPMLFETPQLLKAIYEAIIGQLSSSFSRYLLLTSTIKDYYIVFPKEKSINSLHSPQCLIASHSPTNTHQGKVKYVCFHFIKNLNPVPLVDFSKQPKPALTKVMTAKLACANRTSLIKRK